MIKPLDVVYVVSEPNNRAFSHRNLFPLQHYVDGFLHLFHALDGRGMDKKGGGEDGGLDGYPLLRGL